MQELKKYQQQGTKLYYPYDVERSPRKIAEAIAYDTDATYMRDIEFGKEGKVKAIRFNRIDLNQNTCE